MAEGSNKRQKKGNFTQQDIYSLLQRFRRGTFVTLVVFWKLRNILEYQRTKTCFRNRYSVTTVLTLLKEVSQVADIKVDWNEMVKKTATGISSAREYQMLWRHLAYHDILEEKLDEGAVPMVNDSDLEFELEAHPPVSSDASSEAAACVKVMIASASLVDVNLSSVVEAPLSINIPSGWSSSVASDNPQLQETNITVPILVPKQPLSLSTVASVDVLDANEIAGGPSRRKRKPWSKKEDAELVAAVQRNGEGNWANILKGDFKGDRTASQLSQRWAIIKKRKENSSTAVGSSADFHALRRAFHLALDMPILEKSKSNFLNARGGTTPNTIITSSNSTRPIAGEPSQPGTQSQHHHRQDSDHMTSSKSRFMNSMKTSTSPALSPDAMVKAAAVAAGARIATPSDAATLLKAAQSKNAVHIIPTGGNSIKSSGPSNINSLPPNVHYIRTGLGNRSSSGHNNVITNASRPGGTHHTQSQVTRPSLPTAPNNPQLIANGSDSPKEKICEEVTVVSGNSRAELVQTSVSIVSCNEAKGKIQDQALHNEADEQSQKESALPGSGTRLESLNNNIDNPLCLSLSSVDMTIDFTGTGAEDVNVKDENKMIEMPVEEVRKNKSTAEEKGNEKGKENRMIELPVQAERDNKSIAEKGGNEVQGNKLIEMPVEGERENN